MDWKQLQSERYSEFSGRTGSKEYWMFVLCYLVVFIVLGMVAGIMSLFSDDDDALQPA